MTGGENGRNPREHYHRPDQDARRAATPGRTPHQPAPRVLGADESRAIGNDRREFPTFFASFSFPIVFIAIFGFLGNTSTKVTLGVAPGT